MRFEEGDFYPSGKKEEDALMHSPSIAIGWLRKNNKKNQKTGGVAVQGMGVAVVMKSYCIGTHLLSNSYLCIWLLDCLLGRKQAQHIMKYKDVL